MGGFVPQPLLEQIRAANDIVDIIGAVIPLKRAGLNFVALCPFHREKSPSFNVNARKQIFHCFGCGKGGDVFTFVREYEAIDFPEAIKRLAERAKIPLEYDNNPAAKQAHFLKDKLLEIHEQMTQRWQALLTNDAGGQRARDYLRDRGVTEEAVKIFRLGYASENWEDIVNWAKSKSYDTAMMEQGGLVVRKEDTGRLYGRFRGRLMFPICDEQGRVIGFSGRVLPGDDDDRKYVNSPETPLFHKSRVMFGLDKSKRALLDKQFAIICEGQLDLIACFMAGVQNIVAPQGTAFTSEHARILKRYVNEVVLCFDADNAGQKATVRVLDDLLGSGLAIRVATIPAPHDPDSFIKAHGAEAFQNLIGQAEAFFDYYLNLLCTKHDVKTDRGRQAVVRGMAEAVRKTGDAMLMDRYAQKTVAKLGLSAINPIAEFKKLAAEPPRFEREEELEESPEDNSWRPSQQEFWLLKLVFLDDDLVPWVAAHIDLDWVQNAIVRGILELGIYPDADGHTIPTAAVVGQIENPRAQSLLTEALGEEREVKNRSQQLIDLLTILRNNHLDRQIAMLAGLAASASSSEKSARLLREQLELRRMRKEPLKPREY